MTEPSVRVPARGTWLRHAVVRGDATTVGLVLLVGGAGLVAAASTAVVSAVWAVPAGLAGVVVGALLVRWSRRAWRALLAEVTLAHAGHDPGPSPVPWVDDALWRARNRFDPDLDAPVLLMAEDDPQVGGFGREGADGAFTGVTLRPVLPEERELAFVDEVPPDASIPERADADTVVARVEATPGRFLAVGPRWPVCCGHAATLVSLKADARHPRALWLPPDPATAAAAERDPNLPRGAHGWQCRACGRRYATDPTW